MCGIAGIYNLNGEAVEQQKLVRMLQVLKHRGPDGEGVYCHQHVGLGHRRLAILDLSERGRQPMTYQNSGYWLTFNGEVYNYLELRQELIDKGYRFCSDTDSEVVLAAYIDPALNVISTYHPGGLDVAFTDPEWGASTARQAIDQGADIVFGAGGKTGNGALIEVAGSEGIFCIGVDTDQWETVPEAHPCLVSSAMKLITPGVFNLIKLSDEGNFPDGNFVGEVGLAPFHDFEDEVDQAIKDQLETIDAGLKDGSISTGYGS